MGTITAGAIMTSLRAVLRDPAPGQWFTDADLLRLLNEAQRHACTLRPELYTVHAAIALVAGSLQALPAQGTALMRVDRNVTSGQVCRLVDAALLDAALRTWPASTPDVDVDEYCHDPRDPKRFYVTPPNTGTGSVMALYAAVPPVLASSASTIALDDVYEMVLEYFALSQAFAADSPRKDGPMADRFYKAFERMLGVNQKTTQDAAPKYGKTPGGA